MVLWVKYTDYKAKCVQALIAPMNWNARSAFWQLVFSRETRLFETETETNPKRYRLHRRNNYCRLWWKLKHFIYGVMRFWWRLQKCCTNTLMNMNVLMQNMARTKKKQLWVFQTHSFSVLMTFLSSELRTQWWTKFKSQMMLLRWVLTSASSMFCQNAKIIDITKVSKHRITLGSTRFSICNLNLSNKLFKPKHQYKHRRSVFNMLDSIENLEQSV